VGEGQGDSLRQYGHFTDEGSNFYTFVCLLEAASYQKVKPRKYNDTFFTVNFEANNLVVTNELTYNKLIKTFNGKDNSLGKDMIKNHVKHSRMHRPSKQTKSKRNFKNSGFATSKKTL